jgi:hypothetical protein
MVGKMIHKNCLAIRNIKKMKLMLLMVMVMFYSCDSNFNLKKITIKKISVNVEHQEMEHQKYFGILCDLVCFENKEFILQSSANILIIDFISTKSNKLVIVDYSKFKQDYESPKYLLKIKFLNYFKNNINLEVLAKLDSYLLIYQETIAKYEGKDTSKILVWDFLTLAMKYIEQCNYEYEQCFRGTDFIILNYDKNYSEWYKREFIEILIQSCPNTKPLESLNTIFSNNVSY